MADSDRKADIFERGNSSTPRHVRSIMKMTKGKKDGVRAEAVGEAKEDLMWWKEVLTKTSEMDLLHKQVSASIATDVLDVAFGYSLELDGVQIQKTIPAERGKHINVKEFETFLKCIKEHASLLKDRQIVWYCDSTAARAAVKRQGHNNVASECSRRPKKSSTY